MGKIFLRETKVDPCKLGAIKLMSPNFKGNANGSRRIAVISSSGQLNQKGKAGIGYIRPENSKPNWIKNRLEKDKAKAGYKSSIPNQSRRGSKKVKSVWVKVQPQRDLNGPHTNPKLNRSHNILHVPLWTHILGRL
ncbi:hypothetical protein F511_32480 [Dorcoceras hygrometricum]|uniref:Uncharacterized protein n=1 Tax=Dorcoceras hygrometricum TaxID=472368 RepID=A0A2Z7CLP9_9LAMI|nr:hypothetical protein F511_32480 [Dorcoceras hygrometricum]